VWDYAKDGEGSVGEDRAWVDQVSFTPSEEDVLKWRFQTAEMITASPALIQGENGVRVFFGSHDGKLYSLDGASGEKLWDYELVPPDRSHHPGGGGPGDIPLAGVFGSSPVVVGNTNIAAATTDRGVMDSGGVMWPVNLILKFDETGHLLEATTNNILSMSGPALHPNKSLYLMGSEELYAYSREDLEPQPDMNWELSPQYGYAERFSSVEYPPDISLSSDPRGWAFLVDYRSVRAWDIPNQELRWEKVFEGEPMDPPLWPSHGGVVADEAMSVYVGTAHGTFYALHRYNGEEQWTFEADGPIRTSAAIGSNGLVYFGSDDHSLYALEKETGELVWHFDAGSEVRSSPAIGTEGTVFFGSEDGMVYGVNGATGEPVWSYQTERAIRSSPTIAEDGMLFVGSFDGYLYALETDSTGLDDGPWPKYKANSANTGMSLKTPPPYKALRIFNGENGLNLQVEYSWEGEFEIEYSTEGFEWDPLVTLPNEDAHQPVTVEASEEQRIYRARKIEKSGR
jgi:outer membrane protein assembly factor BamB